MILAAGLEEIRERIDPGEPHRDNLHEHTAANVSAAGITLLPRNLGEAVEAFAEDPLSKEVFGEEVFDSYVACKTQEWEEFCYAVTDWETDRSLSFF